MVQFKFVCSECASVHCYKDIELVVFPPDEEHPICRFVPVCFSLNAELPLRAACLLLHELHSRHVLEVLVVLLEHSHDLFVCLRDESGYKERRES